MAVSENQKKYISKYNKNHYKFFTVRFKLGEDDDFIEAFDKVGNKTQFVKNALKVALGK